jgi:serine/threonine protein kinase
MNYTILERLGEGKFGDVLLGQHKRTGEHVAIKMESRDTPCKMLRHEATVLHYLYSQGCMKIPLIYWFGIHEDSPTLIMTYYNMTLDEYSERTNMTKPLCNRLIKQIIDLLQSIHCHSIIHRDIKPQNFMFKGDQLFLIDFGLSAVLQESVQEDSQEDTSATLSQNLFLGTPKYISIHLHHGLKPTRRDDLISAGYIYMYLACGRSLPWENIPYSRQTVDLPENDILHYKNQERLFRKSWEQMKNYCTIIGPEILEYTRVVYSLNADESPNYQELSNLYIL